MFNPKVGAKSKSLGVNVFAEEPWLLPHVKSAIDGLELPWGCSSELIDEVKEAAFESVVNGWATHAIFEKLVPSIFRTKRDAKWAFTSITIVGSSAINYARLKAIGENKFRWKYMHIPNFCIYEEHMARDGNTYKIDSIDWPASKYMCRCMAQIAV